MVPEQQQDIEEKLVATAKDVVSRAQTVYGLVPFRVDIFFHDHPEDAETEEGFTFMVHSSEETDYRGALDVVLDFLPFSALEMWFCRKDNSSSEEKKVVLQCRVAWSEGRAAVVFPIAPSGLDAEGLNVSGACGR